MRNFIILNLLRLLGLMPLGMARCLGAIIGYGNWAANSRSAQITRTNLRHCFPEWGQNKLNKITRQSMVQWGISLLEIPLVWGHSQTWLEKKIIHIENEALFREYTKANRGLVLIAPHLGNWEVVGLHCSRQIPMTSMFAPSPDQALNHWVKRSREQSGATLVPTDKRGVMALLKALQNNQMIGILPDQVPARESGDYAAFFGKQALTMSLIHKLIQRSGSKVIYCFAQRVKGGFQLNYRKPPEDIYSEDEKISLAALNTGIETCVHEAISQYQWEYKRFRRQPRGVEDIYKKRVI